MNRGALRGTGSRSPSRRRRWLLGTLLALAYGGFYLSATYPLGEGRVYVPGPGREGAVLSLWLPLPRHQPVAPVAGPPLPTEARGYRLAGSEVAAHTGAPGSEGPGLSWQVLLRRLPCLEGQEGLRLSPAQRRALKEKLRELREVATASSRIETLATGILNSRQREALRALELPPMEERPIIEVLYRQAVADLERRLGGRPGPLPSPPPPGPRFPLSDLLLGLRALEEKPATALSRRQRMQMLSVLLAARELWEEERRLTDEMSQILFAEQLRELEAQRERAPATGEPLPAEKLIDRTLDALQ